MMAAPGASAVEGAKPDDVARFLAGLQPAANSPLAPLTRDPAWQQHAKTLDTIWAGLDERQLSKIRAWSAANLTQPQPVVFYMFSGPDFLYADAFFPNRSTYVLSGLEPVGKLPVLTPASRHVLSPGLAGLRASMGSLVSYSFFITKVMKTDLTHQHVQRHAAPPCCLPRALGKEDPRGRLRQHRQGRRRRSGRPGGRAGLRPRREDRLLRQRRPPADALLLPDRHLRLRAEAERIPQVLRGARQR